MAPSEVQESTKSNYADPVSRNCLIERSNEEITVASQTCEPLNLQTVQNKLHSNQASPRSVSDDGQTLTQDGASKPKLSNSDQHRILVNKLKQSKLVKNLTKPNQTEKIKFLFSSYLNSAKLQSALNARRQSGANLTCQVTLDNASNSLSGLQSKKSKSIAHAHHTTCRAFVKPTIQPEKLPNFQLDQPEFDR